MAKNKIMLMPQYMRKFKCIGSACEDNCCIGWNVSVDKKTYQKYKKCYDKDLKDILHEKVKRNRSSKIDEEYAKIEMEKGSVCPLLDENKLCRIHKGLGEEYLSQTCTYYPRYFNSVNGIGEVSATMSCPEAARKALLNPDVMEFDEVEYEHDMSYIDKKVDTHNPKSKSEAWFWQLRIVTIDILQNRSYKLWERIILVGIFYDKVQKLIEDQKISELPSLIKEHIKRVEQGVFKEYLDEIPSKMDIQLGLLTEVIRQRLKITSINSSRYKECLEDLKEGLKYDGKTNNEEQECHYKKVYDAYYMPFMEEHEYILENYLVNYVFKNAFPLNKEDELMHTYIFMVLHYSLIKMHIVGACGVYKKDLKVDHVIKVIQSFSKAIEHNGVFLTHIYKWLKDHDMISLAYIAILIKH